jgi:hypothetical protein
LRVPDDVELEVQSDAESSTSPGGNSALADVVRDRVRRVAQRGASWQEQYLEWVVQVLGLTVELASGNRPERINIYPPADRSRRTRVAGLNAASGRLAFPRLPGSRASDDDRIEIIYNRGRDGSRTEDGVKVYLDSAEAVEVAKRLTAAALG